MASRHAEATQASSDSLQLSDELISEVVESDAIVLSTPTHNLSMPSSLKAWIDHVVRPNRTFRYQDRKMVGLLSDRPVFVITSSSDRSLDQEHPDFLQPYLLTIFAAIGISSVEFFRLDLNLSHCSSGLVTADEAISALTRVAPAKTNEAICTLWSQLR